MQQNNNPSVELEELNTSNNRDVKTVSNITRETLKNNPKLLKAIVKEFLSSEQYKEMQDVDNYYKFRNTVISNRTKQMELIDETEKVMEDGSVKKYQYSYLAPDLSKANHKMGHGYLYELVNQCKNYLVGRPVKLSWKENSISEELQDFIDDILYKYNDWGKFNQENVKNAQKYVRGWARLVINDKGQLKLLNTDSKEVIPFFDDMDELICLIRVYERYEYNENARKTLYRYAEVYDDKYKDVYVSVANRDFKYVKTESLLQKITVYGDMNPFEEKEDNENNESVQLTEDLSWGRIPWIYWNFNEDQIDALQPIKCFIDMLDIDLSDLANNIDDIQDAIWVLENYEGQSVRQFLEDLKIKKAINVGENGKAEPKTVEIPHEARMKLYDACVKCIYKFGRGIDFSNRDNLGNASGVALKWSYGPLDAKADELEENGQAALNDLFNLIFVYLKAIGKLGENEEYDSNNLEFIFDRTMIINEKEQVEMIEASADIISQKTALENHPFVDDVDDELDRISEDEANGVKHVEDIEGDINEEFDDSEEDESEAARDERDNRNKNTAKNNS